MKIDMCQKSEAFVGKINNLLQGFHNINPNILIKLINFYATSVYFFKNVAQKIKSIQTDIQEEANSSAIYKIHAPIYVLQYRIIKARMFYLLQIAMILLTLKKRLGKVSLGA